MTRMEKRRYFNHGVTEARRKAPITASHGDIAWAGALASHAAETASSPLAFAKLDRTTPNFGRAFGVGTLKANSCPL